MEMRIISRELVKNEKTPRGEIVMKIAFPVQKIDSMMTTEEFVEAFRKAIEDYNRRMK